MSETSSTSGRGGSSAGLILTVIFGLSLVLGVLAFWRYSVSEQHLHQTFESLREKGPELDTEQCVTEVLDWHANCAAMQSLCDHAVPMAMEHCLSGRDRSTYCSNIDFSMTKGRWTYAQCKERGISPMEGAKRRRMKACGNSYGAVQSFCRTGQTGVLL